MMICPVCQGTMQFWIGTPIGLARYARRHSRLQSLGLLAGSAFTVPHRKFDSIGILTSLADAGARGRG